VRTSSESDSGFTADRAIGSARSSVSSLVDRLGWVAPVGRGAGCSDLEWFAQRPVSKVRPPVRGGGGSEGARFPVMVSATERELSTRTEFMSLTATAIDNFSRSAGSFASWPAYRPTTSPSAMFPADLHASIVVVASSHDATPGSTAAAPPPVPPGAVA
jgi:hypothetical protein